PSYVAPKADSGDHVRIRGPERGEEGGLLPLRRRAGATAWSWRPRALPRRQQPFEPLEQRVDLPVAGLCALELGVVSRLLLLGLPGTPVVALLLLALAGQSLVLDELVVAERRAGGRCFHRRRDRVAALRAGAVGGEAVEVVAALHALDVVA